jgi:uncharacterized Zn finger protein
VVSKLGSLLDRDRVLALAGDRFLERGERYVSEGRVRAIDEDDSAIAGIVSGTHGRSISWKTCSGMGRQPLSSS